MADDRQSGAGENQTPSPPQGNDNDLGRTTFDVSQEAEEALRRFTQSRAAQQDQPRAAPSLPADQPVRLQFKLEDSGETINVTLDQEAIVGRRDPGSTGSPAVDLTHKGAYQMGVSRRHAVLRRVGDHLELTDLGSRNGSYVNGRQAKAHQPMTINNGDELRFGKIVMVLTIESQGDY